MDPINALFNNAGIVMFGDTTTQDAENFRRIIEVNPLGIFLGMKYSAPFMKKSGGGDHDYCSHPRRRC